MEFFRNNKRYFITIAIGIVITAYLYFAEHLTSFHDLASALFVPGVFLLAAGVLVLVANEGIFNGASYGLKAIWKALTDWKNPKMDESYYDYHMRKTGSRVRFGHLLIVGAVFIALSILCVMMM